MKTRNQLKHDERHHIEELEFRVAENHEDIALQVELSNAYFMAGLFFEAFDLLDAIDQKRFSQESFRLRIYFANSILIMLNPENEHLDDEAVRETFKQLYPIVKAHIYKGFFTDAYQAHVLYKTFGKHVFIDFAYYFLRRAAQLGHPDAQIDLALEYYHGGLLPKNHTLAFAWTKKVADTGNRIGLNNLGNFYFLGVGTEVNYELAFKYMHEAMLMGETISYNELGYLSYHGLGTEKDIDKAIDIWEKGAALNNTECIHYLEQYKTPRQS